MALVIYESFTSGVAAGGYTVSNTTYQMQQITIDSGDAHDISHLKLKLYRVSTPGTLYADIYAIDVNGEPTGDSLGQVSWNANGFTTDSSGVDYLSTNFNPVVPLVASTTYAIVLSAPDSSHGSSYVQVKVVAAGGYDGKYAISSNAGVVWSAPTTTPDFYFIEYGGSLNPSESEWGTKTLKKRLVVIGDNELWYEEPAGTMIVLAASQDTDIDVSKKLNIFEAFQKVFMVNATNLKVADFTNVKIIDANGFTTKPVKGDIVYQAGSDAAQMVVDYIDSANNVMYGYVISGTFEATTVITTAISGGGTTVFPTPDSVTSPPHWYDWTPYDGIIQSSDYGTMPNTATLGCLYRGRIVISGDEENPHQWYMTKQLDPWNILYSANDAQSPVAGQNADAGKLGGIITALAPYKDDYLIFGCTDSIYLLSGDPAEGGSLAELDLTTGIYGSHSWCWAGEGILYFWGTNGIYKVKIPGEPVCISEILLPKLVGDEAVNPDTHRIVFGYDRRRAGILVAITKLSDGSNSNYWFDLRTEGFFPESYPNECGIYSMFYYDAFDPDYRQLVLGCKNGYLSYLKDTAVDDDNGSSDIAIDSYVTFGPLQVADDPKYQGKITGLDIISAGGASDGSQSDSDDIDCKLYMGNSAEQVAEKLSANTNPNFSKTITAPGRRRGQSIKRKFTGVYAGIRLGNNTAAKRWGFEQLLVDARKSGRFK